MELVCSPEDEPRLPELAARFQVKRSPSGTVPFHLDFRDGALKLVKKGDPVGVWVRELEVRRRLRGGFLLGRACGIRRGQRLRVLDATAGMGVDGLALALAGQRVHLVEREPVLWAMLGDLMTRLALGPPDVRLSLDDSRRVLAGEALYDVVYLDPMFPPRSKSALPGKRMQYLAALLGSGEGADEALVRLARSRARSRVVLKGRAKEPPVAEPDWSVRGRAVRYDVFRGRAG